MLPAAIPVSQEALADFCRRWKVSELALFGSALHGDLGPDSDVDMLVTFEPEADWSLFDHVRMEQELKALFNREVDLVSRRGVERSENWVRRESILSTAQTIYVSK